MYSGCVLVVQGLYSSCVLGYSNCVLWLCTGDTVSVYSSCVLGYSECILAGCWWYSDCVF